MEKLYGAKIVTPETFAPHAKRVILGAYEKVVENCFPMENRNVFEEISPCEANPLLSQ